MVLVALTGGIASGKSTVSRRLATLGAVIVDADVLAREVVEPGTPALKRIAEVFGDSVVNVDGSLNRAALSTIVFADDARRRELNSITHPAVWARAKELFDAAFQADPDAVVVYDVPLLVEASDSRPLRFDGIVVVEAPASVRLERLMSDRGMSRDEAEARIAAQATDAQRRAVADVVIDNGGSYADTERQVDELWHALIKGQLPAPE